MIYRIPAKLLPAVEALRLKANGKPRPGFGPIPAPEILPADILGPALELGLAALAEQMGMSPAKPRAAGPKS